MPRNTFLVVIALAVLAALVVGVNIGKRLSNAPSAPPSVTTPTLSPTPTPIQPVTYTSNTCGVSFDYPADFIKQEASESAGALITDPKDPKTMIVVACQKNIPRVPLPPERIETIRIASISAKLYHDRSLKDGTPIDKLIFYNPKTKLDVFLAGLGPVFDAAVASLKIL